MPKKPKHLMLNDLPLPIVTMEAPLDIDALSAKLASANMSPEAMIETAIYLRRQIEKAGALEECVKVLTGRIKAFYASLPADKRETRRVKVGMATYTEPGEKIELIDRDKTVEMLTEEQLRITYKPDVRAMETILKPADFNRLTKKVPTADRVTIRDNRASDVYDELDF